MGIKFFPKALYKGDSVSIVFNLTDETTKEKYVFQPGDKLQIGIKDTLDSEEYQIKKDITITDAGTDVNVYFSPEETDKLTSTESKAILEARLTYNEGQSRATTYQKDIKLEGVVIDE